MTEQKLPYWTRDGQLFVCDGYAWGVLGSGQTICVGTEADIKRGELGLEPTGGRSE